MKKSARNISMESLSRALRSVLAILLFFAALIVSLWTLMVVVRLIVGLG